MSDIVTPRASIALVVRSSTPVEEMSSVAPTSSTGGSSQRRCAITASGARTASRRCMRSTEPTTIHRPSGRPGGVPTTRARATHGTAAAL